MIYRVVIKISDNTEKEIKNHQTFVPLNSDVDFKYYKMAAYHSSSSNLLYNGFFAKRGIIWLKL